MPCRFARLLSVFTLMVAAGHVGVRVGRLQIGIVAVVVCAFIPGLVMTG